MLFHITLLVFFVHSSLASNYKYFLKHVHACSNPYGYDVYQKGIVLNVCEYTRFYGAQIYKENHTTFTGDDGIKFVSYDDLFYDTSENCTGDITRATNFKVPTECLPNAEKTYYPSYGDYLTDLPTSAYAAGGILLMYVLNKYKLYS
jgi:hypothetical protein